MLNSLRARNVALLVIVVLVGQILSFVLIWALAIRPQAERVGTIMARNVAAISSTMESLPPADRQSLITNINRGGAIRILPGGQEPPQDRGIPTLLERIFVRSFAREMASDDVVVWRGSQNGQLWVRVPMGGTPMWVSYERPSGWSPSGALLASFAIAVTLALIGGIALQRRIAQPLRAFADAADALRTDAPMPELLTDGPREIAMAARSFNRMQARLAEHERERAFILAGISHDLRTPIAKIRLLTAMQNGLDAESEAMLNRQFDQLDAMLSQFLDFARAQESETATAVEVGAVVREIAAMLDCDLMISGRDQLRICAPPLALRRALTNLIRNAMLYGQPPFSVELAASPQAAKIRVIDCGAGVANDRLATLSQPFVRGAEARPSDGGTGLGLAIVQQVAIVMGGALHLRNRSGGGFTAELVLPQPGR